MISPFNSRPAIVIHTQKSSKGQGQSGRNDMLCSTGGNVTSAGWQVTLCDPVWHVSARRGKASCKLLFSVYSTYFTVPLCWP